MNNNKFISRLNNQPKHPNNIKNFKYKIENDETIDITPIFVFIAGLLYNRDESRFDSDMYKISCLQRDLAKETVGKHFFEFIKKDERKYSYNSDPEALFYNDEKTNTLYKNICITFFKTIQIVDQLVFLNINYDFSDKIFDFLHFAILFELYKLYLSEKDYDKELISYVNTFFIKNSIMAYTKNIKDSVIVKEGANFIDYILEIITFLVSSKNLKLKLEDQIFFKQFIKDFPEIVAFLSVDYGEKEIGKHFDKVYDEKSFLTYYKEKAKPYYKEIEYIPLIAISGLSKKIALFTFESLLRDVWLDVQIKYHIMVKNDKIKELEDIVDKTQRENKNLKRNYAKKEEENERLAKQISNSEKDKNIAIQKVKDEFSSAMEELKALRADNFSLKSKLAKQANRIKNLSDKINLQYQIINRIPNIHDYINSESELNAVTEEELMQECDDEITIEEMKEAIKDKRLFFIHGIQGYEKNLEAIFKRYEHVCVNDKVANFCIPQDIDGVVALVKTTPHAHIERAIRMKQESVPFIPSTNKNIDLVVEDIYNFYFKKK